MIWNISLFVIIFTRTKYRSQTFIWLGINSDFVLLLSNIMGIITFHRKVWCHWKKNIIRCYGSKLFKCEKQMRLQYFKISSLALIYLLIFSSKKLRCGFGIKVLHILIVMKNVFVDRNSFLGQGMCLRIYFFGRFL